MVHVSPSNGTVQPDSAMAGDVDVDVDVELVVVIVMLLAREC
jgi:hypothetical protein